MGAKSSEIKNGTIFHEGKPIAEISTKIAKPVKIHKSPLDVLKSNTIKEPIDEKSTQLEEDNEKDA